LLQAADYAMWAVQRAFERGEMRYFDFIGHKTELVWDIYDFEAIKAGQPVMYTRGSNPFMLIKSAPLTKPHLKGDGMKPTFTKAS
jgi:hypothetical protein